MYTDIWVLIDSNISGCSPLHEFLNTHKKTKCLFTLWQTLSDVHWRIKAKLVVTCLPSCQPLIWCFEPRAARVWAPDIRWWARGGLGWVWPPSVWPEGEEPLSSLSLQCWVTPVCSILRSSVHHWRPAVRHPVRATLRLLWSATLRPGSHLALIKSVWQNNETQWWPFVFIQSQFWACIERSLQAPKISLLLYRMPSLFFGQVLLSLFFPSSFIFKRNWVKWLLGYPQIYYQQLIKIIGQYPSKISGNGFSGTRNNFCFLCF